MSRKPNTSLDDGMTEEQICEVLEALVFTASHDYRRSISLTRESRNVICRALDLAAHGRTE